MTNQSYVLDHIHRIENCHKNNPPAQLNSKWRIASNQDLFRNLNSAGSLTTVQIERVDKFIAEVKRTGGASIK